MRRLSKDKLKAFRTTCNQPKSSSLMSPCNVKLKALEIFILRTTKNIFQTEIKALEFYTKNLLYFFQWTLVNFFKTYIKAHTKNFIIFCI